MHFITIVSINTALWRQEQIKLANAWSSGLGKMRATFGDKTGHCYSLTCDLWCFYFLNRKSSLFNFVRLRLKLPHFQKPKHSLNVSHYRLGTCSRLRQFVILIYITSHCWSNCFLVFCTAMSIKFNQITLWFWLHIAPMVYWITWYKTCNIEVMYRAIVCEM